MTQFNFVPEVSYQCCDVMNNLNNLSVNIDVSRNTTCTYIEKKRSLLSHTIQLSQYFEGHFSFKLYTRIIHH